MKVSNILLFFVLFYFAHASNAQFDFMNLAEVSDIQKDPYGKSLVETISLALQSKGGDIKTVQNLLNELLFKLQQDQSKADAAWAVENARLKAKIARLEKEIEKLRLEILELEAIRAKYLKLIQRVKENLKQYNNQLSINREQVIILRRKRSEDKADYVRSQSEHTDIINALDTVIKELHGLIGSISGKGRPTHVEEMSEEKRDRLYKAFLQISKDDKEVAEFIQTATEADQNALMKLIAILSKLRASTVKSYNLDTVAEKKSQKTFQTLKAIIEVDNKKLASMIITSEKNLNTYEKKVAQLTVQIAAKTALRKAKISERLATIKEREMKERQYLTDKAEREREMAIIVKLQEIVKKRLANMSAYLKSNVQG